MPNVSRSLWDLVAADPPYSGHFRLVFCSLSYYHAPDGLMALRIQNPDTQEFWGLDALTPDTPVKLGAAGAVGNQKWIVELV